MQARRYLAALLIWGGAALAAIPQLFVESSATAQPVYYDCTANATCAGVTCTNSVHYCSGRRESFAFESVGYKKCQIVTSAANCSSVEKVCGHHFSWTKPSCAGSLCTVDAVAYDGCNPN
jgi:hypothetical protein